MNKKYYSSDVFNKCNEMPHFLAYGCTPKPRAAVQAKGEKISYYIFQEDKVATKAWIAKIKRANFGISKHSRDCSLYLTKE